MDIFTRNEHGLWCNLCNEHLLAAWEEELDDEDEWPDHCKGCHHDRDGTYDPF